MTWQRLLSQVHKLVALAVGVQIVLWFASGLVMSFLDLERVRGEDRIAATVARPLPADALPPALAGLGSRVTEVVLRPLLNRPVAEVELVDGRRALLDARSGAVLSPLGEEWARALAAADHAGPGGVASATLVMRDAPAEYQGALPVWQVTVADGDGTRLYISPDTGRVLARRNDTWRLFDFFWMLHIMDYEERTDFNHPLLVIASAAALLVALSGLTLLLWRLRRSDFRWIGFPLGRQRRKD